MNLYAVASCRVHSLTQHCQPLSYSLMSVSREGIPLLNTHILHTHIHAIKLPLSWCPGFPHLWGENDVFLIKLTFPEGTWYTSRHPRFFLAMLHQDQKLSHLWGGRSPCWHRTWDGAKGWGRAVGFLNTCVLAPSKGMLCFLRSASNVLQSISTPGLGILQALCVCLFACFLMS